MSHKHRHNIVMRQKEARNKKRDSGKPGTPMNDFMLSIGLKVPVECCTTNDAHNV